jgi:hypothetical protein
MDLMKVIPMVQLLQLPKKMISQNVPV